MKLDLQSLSAEPLVYMLMQSGAFVTVLGIVFFLIGLLFGYASWGRYKGKTRALRAEAAGMKEEVANLKRRLGELSVKSGPAAPMVTEMIVLPKKDSPPPVAPPPETAAPAAAGSTNTNADADKDSLPPAPASIKAAAPAEPGTNGASTSHAPAPSDTAPPPDTAAPASPLASLIMPTVAAPAKTEAPSPQAEDMLVLPEIPLTPSPRISTAPPTIKPDFDFDSQLGLIYKSRPEESDDLTVLKGVAPTLEQRLQTLGVYTYEQIAGWTQDQVREFSSRLSFKDRIQREQWVEQARELLADRHKPKAVMPSAPAHAEN